MTVAKQYTYGPFSDWLLRKAIVYDDSNREYEFDCDCWLTNKDSKRVIQLSLKNGKHPSQNEQNIFSSTKESKIFPMTGFILIILLLVILLYYFASAMCKKCHRSSIEARRRSIALSNTQRRNTGHRHRHRNNDLDKESDDEEEAINRLNGNSLIYRRLDTTEQPTTTTTPNEISPPPPTTTTNATTVPLNEDSPPDYKELFPLKKNAVTSSQASAPLTPQDDNNNPSSQV